MTNRRSRGRLSARIRLLVRAIEQNDEVAIEQAISRLSSSRRVFAPLGFAIGALVMLFDGLKLLVSNWRLALVQVLPALWIWLAMLDLKVHVLHGHSFHALRGPILIPIVAAIALITVASFFLNAVFAFAIAGPGRPEVRPAMTRARQNIAPIVLSGTVMGLLLGFSTAVVTRWGRPWFTIALGIVIGAMTFCYVAVPARLIGMKPALSRRDKLATTAVGGAISLAVCSPPYLLGRVGILMLGSKALLLPGIIVVTFAATLQAGATGAVRALKVSASLATARRSHQSPSAAP